MARGSFSWPGLMWGRASALPCPAWLIVVMAVLCPVAAVAQSTQQTGTTTARPGQQAGEPGREGRQGRERRPTRRQEPAQPLRAFDESQPSREAGPVRREAQFSADLTAGHDDNITGGLGSGSGSNLAPSAMASGYSGDLNAMLSSFTGNNRHSFQMESVGRLQTYPDYLDQPAVGGAIALNGRTTWGTSTTLGASQRVGYEPLFSVMSSLASATPLPAGATDTHAPAGLFERRSFGSTTTFSIEQWLTRTASFAASYSYNTQRFIDDDNGDSNTHSATAGLRARLATGVRGRVDYRYLGGEYVDRLRGNRPRTEHRIEAGPDVQHVMSRRRSFTLSLAAGAGYIETVSTTSRKPYETWVPTGRGNLTIALSPTWQLAADYRRDFQLLQGITDEVYRSDSASLMTNALVGSRLSFQLGGTYSSMVTPVPSGLNDTMEVVGGMIQLRLAVTKHLGATAGYHYYQHHYSNPSALPAGFPATYDRRAVRVGLSLWLPLAGTPSAPAAGGR